MTRQVALADDALVRPRELAGGVGLGALLGALFLWGREKSLLDLQYRAALVGYSFFSASMVSGGIWGYYAWGTYWLWTPKELWTSILWLFYSLYLHLRLKGPQWDRAVAWGGLVGFGVTLFTYLGVSMLMKKNKVEVIGGYGKLKGKGKVEVKTKDGVKTVEAKNIILATGSEARMLPGLTPDAERIVTNRTCVGFDQDADGGYVNISLVPATPDPVGLTTIN